MISKEIELECPSGLRVRLRSMKGKDLDGLRDKRRLVTGEAWSKLLDDCTIEVLDEGPYGNATSLQVLGSKAQRWSWKQALVGDRVRALLGLRSATSGEQYPFRVRCGNDRCRRWIDWEVDLAELPIKPLLPESRELFVNGNRFETVVDGKAVVFHLTTGEDQAKAVRLQERFVATQRQQRERGLEPAEGMAMLALATRILEVEGEPDIVAFLAELDLGEIERLVTRMDKVDCGVETGIQVSCSECGEVTSTDLPLDASFFRQNQAPPRGERTAPARLEE